MWALWLIPVVVLGVGMFFLLKAFVRVNQAMVEMRETLAELGEMGPRLQRLAGDISQLAENVEEKRPQ